MLVLSLYYRIPVYIYTKQDQFIIHYIHYTKLQGVSKKRVTFIWLHNSKALHMLCFLQCTAVGIDTLG